MLINNRNADTETPFTKATKGCTKLSLLLHCRTASQSFLRVLFTNTVSMMDGILPYVFCYISVPDLVFIRGGGVASRVRHWEKLLHEIVEKFIHVPKIKIDLEERVRIKNSVSFCLMSMLSQIFGHDFHEQPTRLICVQSSLELS